VAYAIDARARGSRRWAGPLWPGAGAAVALLLFWPFLREAQAAAGLSLVDGVLQQGKHHLPLSAFAGGGFLRLLGLAVSWEPFLVAGTLLALVAWLRPPPRGEAPRMSLRPEAVVMLAFALPYAFVLGLYDRLPQRFLLPLVPFMAVATAWGVTRLSRRAARPRLLAGSLALGLALPQTAGVLKLAYLRSLPTTLEEATGWLAAHARPERDRIIAVRPNLPGLWRTPEALAAASREHFSPVRFRRNWDSYQRQLFAEEPGRPTYDLRWAPVGKQVRLLRGELVRDPESYLRRLTSARWVLS